MCVPLVKFFITYLPKTDAEGGGVALLYKKCYKLKKLSPDTSYASFEFTDSHINYMSSNLRKVVVYRSPPSNRIA